MTNKQIDEFVKNKIKVCKETEKLDKIDFEIKRINEQLLDFYTSIEEKLKALGIIEKYFKLNENYSEQSSGSTKAIEIIVPNCITVEEDDQYIDDCYPNEDFEFLKEFFDRLDF